MVHVVAPVVEQDAPPGLAVAMNPVIGSADDGTAHDTVALFDPATTVTPVGGSGESLGFTLSAESPPSERRVDWTYEHFPSGQPLGAAQVTSATTRTMGADDLSVVQLTVSDGADGFCR